MIDMELVCKCIANISASFPIPKAFVSLSVIILFTGVRLDGEAVCGAKVHGLVS